MIYRKIKRIVDLGLTAVLLPLLAPVFILVALAVRIGLGNPVIFCQQRVGINESDFQLYKFRTMLHSFDSNGNLLPDNERISQLGNILRKLSLDELPQLFNVLLGDMSIVGPRPLLSRYLPFYTERESLRHSVRPGITGLAQVSGRNALTWDEKLRLDVEYVETLSPLLDISIVARTVLVVLRGSTVSADKEEVGQIPFDEYRQRQNL
jgi:undecaprenyl phosphate N,N'-diacetylbacillosamine 1-phosphate transferase